MGFPSQKERPNKIAKFIKMFKYNELGGSPGKVLLDTYQTNFYHHDL